MASSSNETVYTTESGVTYTVVDHSYWSILSPFKISHAYDVTITAPDGSQIFSADNINRGIDILNLIQLAASGDVITGSGDSFALAQLLSFGNYISVPGSTGSFIIVAGVATANAYYIGGNNTISGLANLVTGSAINIVGGTATLSGTSGSLIGALSGSTVNVEYGGTLDTGTGLAGVLSGATVKFGDGGGTIILNGGGTLINLLATGSANATTFNNYDPSKDTIELKDTVSPVSGYNIADNGGNSRTITLFGTDGKPIAEYSVNIADDAKVPAGNYNNAVNSQDLSKNPLQITYANGNTYIGACFLAGSMIRTTTGEVAVEDVRIGDEIIAFDWRNNTDVVRPVVWVGKAHVNVHHGLPDDEAGWPVRILKDAIDNGVPYKDMLITAEHCLFFQDRFVPARMLVNGVSVFYDKSISSYDYYHVETEQHSVITADGMLTESYLDTGNRSTFRQEGKVALLHGTVKSWEDDAGAPLEIERSFVESLYRAIEARQDLVSTGQTAVQAIELTNDPDLHLVTETGAIIHPMRHTSDNYSFMLPSNIQSVRLVSRASRPADVIGPFVDDRRYMGVAIGNIQLFSGRETFDITSHLQTEKPEGWHADMGWEGVAWTNGNATLLLGEHLKRGRMGVLSVTVKAAGPYLIEEKAMISVRRSA